MERLKIKIHPLFALYVFLCIYFGWYNDIFYYIVVLVLHEYGHYFMTRHLGYSTEGMMLSIYGSSLKTNNCYKVKDEVIIALAGPIVNIILIVIFVALWWFIPSLYLFTKSFVICNLIVLAFNMLPIYPLDGGRVILALFSKKFSRQKLEKVSAKICFSLGIILLGLFVYSLLIKINYNLLIMGIFLILNSTMSSANDYVKSVNSFTKKYSKPVEVKVFKVRDINRSQMIKYLSPHYYSIFEIDGEGKQIRVEEKDLY